MEIERLHLPAAATPAQRYQWLRYVPATNQLTPLAFISMHSAPPFEERIFQQGSLQFSALAGTFQAPGAAPVVLRREFLLELPPALAEQLA